MKKVLFISYAFPPVGGVGVLRNVKFIKYLTRLGWKIFILTAENSFSRKKDKNLLNEIPLEVKICKASYIEPLLWSDNHWWQSLLQYFIYRLFLFPDRESLWQKSALKQAQEIIENEGIDLVFTSSAALSNHFIAYKLKEKTSVRWVADFRDEWSINPEFHFPTFLHKNAAEKWEKLIVEKADRVTTVSEPLTAHFQGLVKEKNKVSTITNGFDSEDFGESHYQRGEFCRMVHIGTLYGGGKNNVFKEAVEELNLPKLKVEFVGYDLYLSHVEAVKKMQNADILLLITSPKPRPALYSGKIFEYLAARRPILALSAHGTMLEKVILELGVGEVVEPLDKAAIKNAILKLYQSWENNQLSVPQADIEKYDRQKLTGKLAAIFDELKAEKKLRVCLVGSTVSPQNEKLTRYLLEQGYDVHFVSLDETEIEGATNYHIQQKKLVNKFAPWYLFQGLMNKQKALTDLKKLIQEIQPDVVHGHGINFAGILAYYSGFQPVVVTTRGSDIMQISEKPGFEQYLIKQTLKNSDIVTGSSLALKKQALKLGVKEENWRDVFFGIDLDIFKKMDVSGLKKELNINDEKVIFCPRSIAPIYNTDVLIEALNKLAEKNWKLILLTYRADQSYLAKMKDMIKSFGREDKIIWIPEADPAKMAELNNLADVVVSLAQSDGAAVSFLEAMACEAKIVISAVGFVEEWADGKFWVVPIGDIEETTRALDEALKTSKEEFKPDGEKNRQLIADRAEINSNFHKFENIYEEVLK